MNSVYNLDDKLVVKIESDEPDRKNCLKGQRAISDKLIAVGAKVPRIFEEGEYQNQRYLLMEKLGGLPLTQVWPDLDSSQKEGYISEIANQLKLFHQITFDSYAIKVNRGREFPSFAEALRDATDFSKIDRAKLAEREQEMVAHLENFFESKLHILKDDQPPVFVHNDIHFENVFVADGRIAGIIDFDRWCQAPAEYELQKIMDFFHMPFWYVEGHLLAKYQKPMEAEAGWLKKYYPELFAANGLADRIRLFQVEGAIWLIGKYQEGRWQDTAMRDLRMVFQDYYQNGWLDEVLQ